MSLVVRKLRSAFGLLSRKDSWDQVPIRLGENLRGVRLMIARDGELRYRHRNGFDFVVMPQVPETRNIYHRAQRYEWTESNVISRWLEPGDFALDCGANVGVMTA